MANGCGEPLQSPLARRSLEGVRAEPFGQELMHFNGSAEVCEAYFLTKTKPMTVS